MKTQEIYVSTDIETSGPIMPRHSILSLGSAAFLADGSLVDTFSANLQELEGATYHPDTLKWWESQPEAWDACRKNARPPKEVMVEYHKWLKALPGLPVFVAYPAGFDFTFVYWYLVNFVGDSPFSFSALDIKSYAAALLHRPYRECTKKNFPRRWFGNTKHNHTALDDAIEQGQLFINMLKENKNVR